MQPAAHPPSGPKREQPWLWIHKTNYPLVISANYWWTLPHSVIHINNYNHYDKGGGQQIRGGGSFFRSINIEVHQGFTIFIIHTFRLAAKPRLLSINSGLILSRSFANRMWYPGSFWGMANADPLFLPVNFPTQISYPFYSSYWSYPSYLCYWSHWFYLSYWSYPSYSSYPS